MRVIFLPVRLAFLTAAGQYSICAVNREMMSFQYRADDLSTFLIFHMIQLSTDCAAKVQVFGTMWTGNHLVKKMAAVSFSKTFDPSFFHQLGHQPVESTFAWYRRQLCIRLHSFCQLIN